MWLTKISYKSKRPLPDRWVTVYDSGTTYSQSLPCVELELIPLRESACRQGHHKFDAAGSNVGVHGPCINPNCKSRSRFICVGCTRDVDSLVWVCEPAENKPCWKMLHKTRVRYPVDNDGNPIERPSLTKNRRRTRSLGSDRVDKRQKRPTVLNPHHT